MTTSLELGWIFGIQVGINWSWLVVFALIAWTLADGVFPSTNPVRSCTKTTPRSMRSPGSATRT